MIHCVACCFFPLASCLLNNKYDSNEVRTWLVYITSQLQKEGPSIASALRKKSFRRSVPVVDVSLREHLKIEMTERRKKECVNRHSNTCLWLTLQAKFMESSHLLISKYFYCCLMLLLLLLGHLGGAKEKVRWLSPEKYSFSVGPTSTTIDGNIWGL